MFLKGHPKEDEKVQCRSFPGLLHALCSILLGLPGPLRQGFLSKGTGQGRLDRQEPPAAPDAACAPQQQLPKRFSARVFFIVGFLIF